LIDFKSATYFCTKLEYSLQGYKVKITTHRNPHDHTLNEPSRHWPFLLPRTKLV